MTNIGIGSGVGAALGIATVVIGDHFGAAMIASFAGMALVLIGAVLGDWFNT